MIVMAAVEPNRMDTAKTHLRCPECALTNGGRAARRKWQRQVSRLLRHRCYVCDRCPCEWVVEIRSENRDGTLYVTVRVIEVRQ